MSSQPSKKKPRELSPPTDLPDSYEAVRDQIILLLRQEIYIPLVKAIRAHPKTVLKNSIDDLLQAVASGQIQYVGTHFEGSFTAAVSREIKKLGGTWDRTHGRWKISRSALPADVSAAIGTSYSRFREMSERVDKQIEKMVPKDIASKLSLEKIYDATIYKTSKGIDASLKAIAIPPILTPEQRRRISEEYERNMQLYIQEWTEKEIVELRKKIQEATTQGFRYEGFAKAIKDSYGVSMSKAKFLARQETKLLTTKIQQTRYQEAGVNKYRWRCVAGSSAHPVRPMHKALDGTIHTWDNPPVVSEDGSRKNPGQDYGCRCKAIPIVEF